MNLYFNTYKNPFRLDETLIGAYPTNDADFPIRFSYGSSFEFKPLVDEVKFGDGYAQRSSSGIVRDTRECRLVFDKRRRVVARALRRFFLGDLTSTIYNRTPDEFFYMLLPDPLDEVSLLTPPRKFVCSDFQIVPVEYDSLNISVNIQEWFGP